MTAEPAGWGKFAQAMANHVLGNVDRNVAATVMHCNRMPNHLGEDGAGAAPGADDLLFAFLVHIFNSFQ